uniref:Uncharacterized protein n=1 Tax=Plectus sambesii TaxID=2011161 RepID=A0A914UPS8_9BILA
MSRATVVVLGDIGRSPRMGFHALSLAQKGIFVDLVGYTTTKPDDHLLNNANIRMVSLPPPPDFLSSLPAGVSYGLKFLWTAFFLLLTLLFRNGFPSLILMQNPPGIPCMAICHAVARIKRAKFAVDWHNYTWTILRETIDDRRHSLNQANSSANAQTTKKAEKKQVGMKH